MISRREFEKEGIINFVGSLFWNLEAWSDSLKRIEGKAGLKDREGLEIAMQSGYMMRLSHLTTIVDDAYRRLYIPLGVSRSESLTKRNLNNAIKQYIESHRQWFNIMGSYITVSDTVQIIIQVDNDSKSQLFLYLTWWLLDAWPDSKITVDFEANKQAVQIVFWDSNKIHTLREFEKDHKNLVLWKGIIDYLTVIGYHGRCIWPQEGELRRLKLILPVRPPTEEELDAPLPVWLQ